MAESDHAGMMPRDEWEQTDVHKASDYFCGKCGQQFPTPHDVYDHLDQGGCEPPVPEDPAPVVPEPVRYRSERRRQPTFAELCEHVAKFGPDEILTSAKHLSENEYAELERVCRRARKERKHARG